MTNFDHNDKYVRFIHHYIRTTGNDLFFFIQIVTVLSSLMYACVKPNHVNKYVYSWKWWLDLLKAVFAQNTMQLALSVFGVNCSLFKWETLYV